MAQQGAAQNAQQLSPDDDNYPDPNTMGDDNEPTEDFIPDMEKIKTYDSHLTDMQEQEKWRLIRAIYNMYDKQQDVEAHKNVLRLRDQFLHMHGTLGLERVVDCMVVMKAIQMLEQGMSACILNLNFLKRLQTRSLFEYLRNYAMKRTDNLRKMNKDMVKLKIQEEDADEVDIRIMMDNLNDLAEDWPLFVMTDETCKEVERIDDAIEDLTNKNHRFHFWTSSIYAHGTPDAAERHRLGLNYDDFARPIRQVMDMIDIDDDDMRIGSRYKTPIRRIVEPLLEPGFNVRENLGRLKVFLISHNKHHLEPDVWDCEKCGQILADYLNNTIELGKPGLKNNEVFIVGHLERFESKVTISGMQKALIENGIENGAMFCRRAVRIQDILETMTGVVVADSISMRGVAKKIVIIIPNPRDPKMQERVEQEMKRRKEREDRDRRDEELASEITEGTVSFLKPKAVSEDDEILFFLRKYRKGDSMDGIHDYKKNIEKKILDEGGEDSTDDEEISGDECDDAESEEPPNIRKPEDIRFTLAAHQSMLRRAINSMSRYDKDMILDVLTDAPEHAVLFHFAEDEFQTDRFLR